MLPSKEGDPRDDVLTSDQITAAFEKVRDQINSSLHLRIEAFIAAPPKWCPEAEALASCEWEIIFPIFDGLRKEAFNLGRETIKFFDEIKPDVILTTDEETYLGILSKRTRVTSPLDEDFTFYNDHRNELKENATLKSRWDKLIFGTPIQEEDFLLGVGLCLESLFDQDIHGRGADRRLVISTERRAKRDLRNINVDAGYFFCCRYRGLREPIFPRGHSTSAPCSSSMIWLGSGLRTKSSSRTAEVVPGQIRSSSTSRYTLTVKNFHNAN